MDPRGNRPGVNAQFTPPNEQLAFAIEQSGEADFQAVYPDPLPIVLAALQAAPTTAALASNLPDLAVYNQTAERAAAGRARGRLDRWPEIGDVFEQIACA